LFPPLFFDLLPARLNLANDAGFYNPGNCSSFWEAERDDPCSRTACEDQGNNDLSRPVLKTDHVLTK